ncbi:hypothetical protein FJZ33_04620, partial [Candidatus Poribacteria bacterium]|nr:hypothetical protein [Candidatus Poribacteria bacterium]
MKKVIIITLFFLAVFNSLALAAPETFIISGPSGTINSRDFAFYWTGRTDTTDSFIRGFYYRMDNGQWNWTQDRSIVYYDFPEGTHRLEVKAVDSNNREDPSPAFRSFTLQQNFALEPNESPFSIQREFQNQLDNGIISDELKLEFLNNFRTLSQNATVTMVTSGSKWLITDRNIIYKLRKEGNRINVYQDDMLFRLSSNLEGELIAGAVSQALRDEFKDNRITLSQNAAVLVIIQGSEWLIDSKYTVKKEGNRLNVYEDKLLFGIELFEYITSFLNNRIISPGLRQDFKLNNITLSSTATVVVEESGKRWLINDQKTFIVMKETNQNKLNVFESINDSPSEAITITPGTTIKALSQPDSNDINGIDEDWFKFSIQAVPNQNKIVNVFFKKPNAISSSIIRVYRYPEVSDGSEIARFTARYSQQTSVSVQQSLDYLIRVTPGTGENPSAPYFLTAIVDDLAPGVIWEREPNNSSSNATDFPSIALSKANYWVEMIGTKWSENDNKDYFRLHTSISQPARLSLNMTNPQKGPALVKISPVYQLSSEIGRFQINPGSNPRWKLEIGIKPGDYTIEVELPGEQDQDFLYFLTLQLSDFPSGEAWELEPNDLPDYAVSNPLFPFGLRFRALKGYLDTKDWYRINISKNGILNLTTSRILKSGALNIYLIDPILQSPVGSPLTYQVYEEPQRDYMNLDILAGNYFMEVDLSKIPGDYWIIAQIFTSASHDAPIDKPLNPGESLNVRLAWEPGNLAYFDIFEITGNNIHSSQPLNKTPVVMYDDGLH